MAGVQPRPTADAVPAIFLGPHGTASLEPRPRRFRNTRHSAAPSMPSFQATGTSAGAWDLGPNPLRGLTYSRYSARLRPGTLHIVAVHRPWCSIRSQAGAFAQHPPSRRNNILSESACGQSPPIRGYPLQAGKLPPGGQEDQSPSVKPGPPSRDSSRNGNGTEAAGTCGPCPGPGSGRRRRAGFHSLGRDDARAWRSSKAAWRTCPRGPNRPRDRGPGHPTGSGALLPDRPGSAGDRRRHHGGAAHPGRAVRDPTRRPLDVTEHRLH